MQEIVDQRINRNQVHADFQPPRANVSGADQNAGQGHGQHLVGNAVDIAQRFNQGPPDALEPVGGGFVGRQPVVDPADQVAIGNVANKQVQAIGNLVEMAVSQAMVWQRALCDVVRLGAGAARLFVAAVMELPVGF